jgi:predicted TIM-barrel fold metal-dependent hydrolase
VNIVDSHIHLWSKGTPRAAHRQAPYSAEQALADMDVAGVKSAIITPPAWDPDAQQFGLDAAARYPDRFSVMGGFPLDAADRESQIAAWKEIRGMRGIRYIFNEPRHAAWLEGTELDWFWSAAADLGIPVALAASKYLPQIGIIAKRFPSLRLIIDHLGVQVDSQGAAAFVQVPQLVALARHANIAVKASGVPAYATDAYPYASIHGYLKTIFDAFGPQRVFWGTDVTKMPCSWRQCVTLFTEEFTWLSPEDRRLIMGDALRNWIGWNA